MRRSSVTWLVVFGLVLVALVAWIVWGISQRPTYTNVTSPRPVLGPESATVTLEEFSDFQCPACKAAHPIVQEVLTTFGDRIKFSYFHFPLVQIHTQAFRASLAAECANDQGKFWEYHDMLFDKQPSFSRDDLVAYATQLELSIDGASGFAACLDSRAKDDVVRADMSEGDKRGIGGTPTFFVNGEAVQDWTQLKSLIQAKLIGG